MHEVLGLTFELQLVLVAGYLAYSIATIRSGHKDSAEHVVLKVLTFGLIARLASGAVVVGLLSNKPAAIAFSGWTESGVLDGGLVIFAAIVAGASWRAFVSGWCSWIMERCGVYRDDHSGSTWMSLVNAPAKWNHVHVFLKNGKVLESVRSVLPEKLPLKPYTVNDDGIALYLTAVMSEAGDMTPDVEFNKDAYSRITFIPYGNRASRCWLEEQTRLTLRLVWLTVLFLRDRIRLRRLTRVVVVWPNNAAFFDFLWPTDVAVRVFSVSHGSSSRDAQFAHFGPFAK